MGLRDRLAADLAGGSGSAFDARDLFRSRLLAAIARRIHDTHEAERLGAVVHELMQGHRGYVDVIQMAQWMDIASDHRVSPPAHHGHRVDVLMPFEARVAAGLDLEIAHDEVARLAAIARDDVLRHAAEAVAF